LRELGQKMHAAITAVDLLIVELLADNLAAAEREVVADYDYLEHAGESYFFPTIAALLSRVVRDQQRDDDALTYSRVAERTSATDDIESQALWRSIRAPIVARQGKFAEAEALARSAVELSRRTDALQMQADTLTELASVLAIAGRPAEARTELATAIDIYQAKGDIVSPRRAQALAARLD
jgi:hypothetical protein